MLTTRRNFLKACGLACLAPLALAKTKDQRVQALKYHRIWRPHGLRHHVWEDSRVISLRPELLDADLFIRTQSLNSGPAFGIPAGYLLFSHIAFDPSTSPDRPVDNLRCIVRLREDWGLRVSEPGESPRHWRHYRYKVYPQREWSTFLPQHVLDIPWYKWPTVKQYEAECRRCPYKCCGQGPLSKKSIVADDGGIVVPACLGDAMLRDVEQQQRARVSSEKAVSLPGRSARF